MTTNNVATGTTDYDLLGRASEEHQQEHGELENNDKRLDDEITRPSSISPVDRVQEDDVFVEENVTPFYMNSGRFGSIGGFVAAAMRVLFQEKTFKKRSIVWASTCPSTSVTITNFDIRRTHQTFLLFHNPVLFRLVFISSSRTHQKTAQDFLVHIYINISHVSHKTMRTYELCLKKRLKQPNHYLALAGE